MNDLIKYNDGEIELAVSVENETIWLTQKQIAELFDKDTRTINEHIKTIYKEEELTETSTIRNFRIVQKEGNREVARVEKYNKQYSNIELKNLTKFHDRFLLIDNNGLYHIGASLKDLGNKTFAFSKLNIDLVEFLGKLK
ncbi:DNA-binding protein [Arcobacter cloacae]|uniref:DNA-binding protein n=1 Tax=Arcobacter cloacae TaxID=1054034 RepID=A0A4Q0ZBC1_9BACT|nr:DNA-binding protein [Arcobacter cloacae]RXJ83102.1 DNA-binding protein [Arcobacter cloacae]